MLSFFRQILEYVIQISSKMDEIQDKLEKAMATLKTFDDLLKAMDAETTRIGTKIDELLKKIADGGMTAEEEDAALAEVQALADRLKTIGVDPAQPIPPVVP